MLSRPFLSSFALVLSCLISSASLLFPVMAFAPCSFFIWGCVSNVCCHVELSSAVVSEVRRFIKGHQKSAFHCVPLCYSSFPSLYLSVRLSSFFSPFISLLPLPISTIFKFLSVALFEFFSSRVLPVVSLWSVL